MHRATESVLCVHRSDNLAVYEVLIVYHKSTVLAIYADLRLNSQYLLVTVGSKGEVVTGGQAYAAVRRFPLNAMEGHE